MRRLDGVILYEKGELKETVIEYIKGSESALGDEKALSDWTAPFKGLDIRGGRLITISNDDEDILEIKWSDGMCIDVGYVKEDKTYYITTTANDTIEAWNSPLSAVKTQNRDELPVILQQEIIRCRS